MSDLLVRLALLLYPSAWRKRYGAELEQLIRDSAEHEGSALAITRLILDVARGGVNQRVGGHRRALRAVLLVSLGIGVIFPVDAATVATQTPTALATWLPSPLITITPTTKLAPGVRVFRFPTSMLPLMRTAEPSTVEVEVSAHGGHVYSIDGPPAHIVLNPHTDRLISVAPITPIRTTITGHG